MTETSLIRGNGDSEASATPIRIGPVSRFAAFVSAILGCTGVYYWVPALGDLPSATAAPGDHPMAMVQRVVELAAQQFRPELRWIVPVFGAFFTVASFLQIPAGLAALTGRLWGYVLLRIVGYTKVAMYIGCGLMLGLAVFSGIRPDDPGWRLSAIHWVLNLGMIAVYWGIIKAANQVLPPLDGVSRGQDANDDSDDDD